MNNVELGNKAEPQSIGYSQWASWMASDPDSETFVFRKFNELAALNLLYFQSEMIELESQLKQMDREGIGSHDMDLLKATRQWETLVAQSKEPQRYPAAKRRIKLISKLRSKIKEYQEALLQQSKVAQLQSPNKRILGALRQMFKQEGCHILDGKAREYLDQKYEPDLVALKSPTEDALSNYLRRTWAVKETSLYDGGPRIGRFDENRVTRWVNIATIVVAAIFLIGPILALYFALSPPVRLTLIAIFTTGFAVSISLITNARRPEIFAATATYAAVLVVFVSNGDLTAT